MPLSKFQIELLKKIPREPARFISMNKMAEMLHDNWGASHSAESKRRKISNNLKKIEETYPNCLDWDKTSREHRFRMKETAPLLLKPLSQEQLMAFGLLSKFGTDLLTHEAHRALSPFFDAAQDAVVDMAREAGLGVRVSEDLGRKWLGKIAVLPAVLPFCPPAVDEEIKQTVHKAVLMEHCLRLRIVHSPSREEEECEVSPLALVQQGVRTYLIARRTGTNRVDRILMARILQATSSFETAQAPANWSLGEFLKQGIGHPVFPKDIYGKLEHIELRINAGSQWLKETPLAPDPVIEEHADGSFTMKVEMPITEELVHWLLSMAFHVRVVQPGFLVTRMADDLSKSAAMYRQAVAG